MGSLDSRFLEFMGLASLDREPISAGGRIDRAILWPAFGPYCVLTVRDFGEVGEVEMVAEGLNNHHFRSQHLEAPTRWTESQIIGQADLDPFRSSMIEIHPENLADVRPSYQYRDGIGFDGEVRRDDIHHGFQIHDDHDLWRANPAHERFFLEIWRLARRTLREELSRRILDPAHYGDLLAREFEAESPRRRTRRARS